MSPSFIFTLPATCFFLYFDLITDFQSSPRSGLPLFPTFLLSSLQGEAPSFICFATSLARFGLGHLSPDACLFSCSPPGLLSLPLQRNSAVSPVLPPGNHCELARLSSLNSRQHLPFISVDMSASAPFTFCSVHLSPMSLVCAIVCMVFLYHSPLSRLKSIFFPCFQLSSLTG